MSGVAEWTSRFDLHRMYLRDGVRNAAYATAIAHHVRPGSRVLDLGTGTGIWACVAAKAGAAKVVAVEFSDLAELARDFDVVIHEPIACARSLMVRPARHSASIVATNTGTVHCCPVFVGSAIAATRFIASGTPSRNARSSL